LNDFILSASSYQVLIVDDIPANIDILKSVLADEGYNISVATSGELALNIIPRSLPDLILMDVMMPGLNGFETCQKIKSDPSTRDIPIIFVTAKNETEDIVKAFDVGGVDYITKPYQYKEVLSRIKMHLQNRTLIKRNEKLISDLREANTRLDKLSRKDPLTSLSNRRDVNEKIEAELVRFKRNKTPFSLLLGDIDHFKKTNDTFGHDAGDYVLVQVAKLMTQAIRRQDVVARWGGEEFLIFLPETGLDGGLKLAEDIRQKIETEEFCFNQKKITVTMSFGACISEATLPLVALVKKADEGLYKAKETGRNQVISI
jgi:diguanylate cyclase (GGDEF)-like protein